jgi:6-phosphofructokinase
MQSVKLVDTFCEGMYMKPVPTIGIVNGGGDAPGLNAVIRGVVRSAIDEHGRRVSGMRNGFDGLIWSEGATELTEESSAAFYPVVAPFDRILGTRFGVAATDWTIWPYGLPQGW